MIRVASIIGVLLLLGSALLVSTSGQQAKPKNGMNIDPTADIHPSVILEGKVTVGAYTKIDAGTVITGNVTIGHHTLIRCNVTIRGTNVIGNYTHIYDNVNIDGNALSLGYRHGNNAGIGWAAALALVPAPATDPVLGARGPATERRTAR